MWPAADLLGRYSDAVRDYARVTALVLPIHPDAEKTGTYSVQVTSRQGPDRTVRPDR